MASAAAAQLEYAFGLLSAAELGQPNPWPGPPTTAALRTRVELLASLLNIVPRSQLRRLADVMAVWQAEFSSRPVVPPRALREAAHTLLRGGTQPDQESAAQSAMRRIEAFLDVELSGEEIRSKPGSKIARKLCASALFFWHTHLSTRDEWTKLSGAVPGDRAVPIEDAYVDLFASPLPDAPTEGIESAGANGGRRRRDVGRGTISAAAMVARTLEACVVVGDPGSGKSTLIQWLAWATDQGRLADFDFALVVRLKHFAAALGEASATGLVEFFLENVMTRIGDWQEAADCLRQASGRQGRTLLLLDGWDEVPAAQRELVRQRIQEESRHFVVVITSRAAGLPRQILPRGRADFYEIAGLAPSAIASFVKKRLAATGDPEQAEALLWRIEAEPDLQAMAANPFMLGLLIGVLSRPAGRLDVPTMGELFHDISGGIVEQQEQAQGASGAIRGAHLRGLERLAFGLLMGEASPRYSFRRQELEGQLGDADVRPLLESRFLNRIDLAFDSWSFLHATLEEYFAACHMCQLPPAEWNREWDRTVCSQSRLVVLEFLAGLNERAIEDSAQRAEHWIRNADRFGLVLIRLARLAATGQWIERRPSVARELYESLWAQISAGADWRFCYLFLQAFAGLNPAELVRRAATDGKVDVRVWEAIAELLPLTVIREGGLYEKLPRHLREHLALRAPVQPSAEHIQRLVSRLADRSLSKAELEKLLEAAALVPVAEVASVLLTRLQDAREEDLSTTLVMALAPLFRLLPMESVMGLLTEQTEMPPTVRQLASAALGHGEGRGERLDPDQRDRLLRRLGALAPDDPRVDAILMSLKGFPVREGGLLIAELARDRTLPTPVRISAIDVLETVWERNAIEAAVGGIESESDSTITELLLELAVKRDVPVSLTWLQSKINATEDQFSRRALLTAYLRMLRRKSAEKETGNRFLRDLIGRAFLSGDEEKAWVLANAVRTAGPVDNALRDASVVSAATDTLQRYVAGRPVSLGQVRLANSLLSGHCGAESQWWQRQTLDAILRNIKKTQQKQARQQLESTASEIATDLAQTSVGQLLQYAPECEPVQEALGALARESGWTVFEDWICDADGNELVQSVRVQGAAGSLAPEVVQELLDSLKPGAPHKALMSFWIVTAVFKLCELDATYKEVFSTIRAVYRGLAGKQAATESLRELYTKEPVSIVGWRQALDRARKRLEQTANGVRFLSELGLPRRK